jgi:hypothetical protein
VQRAHYLFRFAAVVSSVLLVGGFVAYRAGLLDSLIGRSAIAAESESIPITLETGPENPTPEKFHFTGTFPGQSAPGIKQVPPTVMSGSKSYDLKWYPAQQVSGSEANSSMPPLPPLTPQPAPARNTTVPVPGMMSGSKSSLIDISGLLLQPRSAFGAKPPANSQPSAPGQ